MHNTYEINLDFIAHERFKILDFSKFQTFSIFFQNVTNLSFL